MASTTAIEDEIIAYVLVH